MNKLTIILLLFIFVYPLQYACAENLVLKAGVSMSDRVPKGFFGTWKINSTMTYTNNKEIFNEETLDFWNLSKAGDVITLANPFSGARASVTVEDVKDNQITFTHTTENKNAKMTETPTLTLSGENFYGTDKIVIEKFKDGKKISTDIVVYKIQAQKISGSSLNLFMSGK